MEAVLYHLLRLNETINTVIEVDIPSIFPIEYASIQNLKKLVRLLCLSHPYTPNRAKIFTTIKSTTKGDFQIDGKYTLEVGGKSKKFKQIKDMPNSFVVADDIEIGSGNKIPLWLFGFLY